MSRQASCTSPSSVPIKHSLLPEHTLCANYLYDEAGGFFDHIAPKQLDAYGPGLRVPMLIVSPFAKPGYVDTAFSDHSSVLKFIETAFGLPALASINHEFDTSTPTINNLANGAPFPPRDANPALSDLTQCFDFTRAV